MERHMVNLAALIKAAQYFEMSRRRVAYSGRVAGAGPAGTHSNGTAN
jgi:hypothetical protein